MSREVHVRFWEGVGVQLPHATRLRNKVCFLYRLWLVRYYFFSHHCLFVKRFFMKPLFPEESRQGRLRG